MYSQTMAEGGTRKGQSDTDQSGVKRPIVTNNSRQDSQAGSEAETNRSNQAPKMRLLDRS